VANATKKEANGTGVERIEGRIGPDTRFDLVITGPLTTEAMRRLTAAVELFSSAVTDKPAELAGGER
jgi:hypothetical protein